MLRHRDRPEVRRTASIATRPCCCDPRQGSTTWSPSSIPAVRRPAPGSTAARPSARRTEPADGEPRRGALAARRRHPRRARAARQQRRAGPEQAAAAVTWPTSSAISTRSRATSRTASHLVAQRNAAAAAADRQPGQALDRARRPRVRADRVRARQRRRVPRTGPARTRTCSRRSRCCRRRCGRPTRALAQRDDARDARCSRRWASSSPAPAPWRRRCLICSRSSSDTTPVIRDQLRPFSVKAQPTAKLLAPATKRPGRSRIARADRRSPASSTTSSTSSPTSPSTARATCSTCRGPATTPTRRCRARTESARCAGA